ncbi:hypothetical protein SAMN05660690_0222 [Geodermatophilus telluris]|uniref:Uncharacterized protein n=1 Tax=Geodermatophilus telluris TaxID=1190417 RepID=A0A1G6I6K5_9ACTN|nr:hypothetical protein [Geodermatophilus telluris]SDC02134.1 hypothetical protein SAMN05660690_0222 [Geodermatophilus telluris]
MLNTLVGVIVGGSLTLASQVVIELFRERREMGRNRRKTVGVALIQADYLWVAELLLLDLCRTGVLWGRDRNPVHELTSDEMRTLASNLAIEDWWVLAGATRRFREVQTSATAGDATPVSAASEVRGRALGALVLVEEARLRVQRFAGVPSNPVDLTGLPVPDTQVESLAAELIPGRPARRWDALVLEGGAQIP